MLGRSIFLVMASAVGFAIIGPSFGTSVANVVAERQGADPSVRADARAPAQMMASNGGIVIERGADSHFRATMMVNGRPIQMLVDSGATTVALTAADARAIGLVLNDQDFTGTAQTAGGQVAVAPVMIDRLSIGGIEQRHVPAAVIQGTALSQSLLGQSFLSRLSSLRVEGDRMTLN